MKTPPSSLSPLAVFALFAALSLAWTWPLAAYLSSRIAHDPGDPVLNTWLLWWNAHAVPFTAEWWDPPIFFPMRGALALSEHLAGIGLFSTPVQWLGGSAVLAYNIALLLSYALSGLFAYLLVLRLTGSPLAGLCGGMAFAFAPYRAGQLAHLQVLTSQWLPLQLLGLHAYAGTGRRRWLVVFGAAWLIQGLSNGYYLLFTPVLIALWLAWFIDWRRCWRRGAAIIGVWIGCSLPMVPALLAYSAVHRSLGLTRTRGEIEVFSAHPWSFLNPPHLLAFWPPRAVPTEEDYLFPGVTAVALLLAAAAIGGWHLSRKGASHLFERTLLFYVLATVVIAVLTFGPGAPDAGGIAWLRPYRWLMLLPGFDSLRVPARFAMLSTLCLSVAGGIAFARLEPARRTSRVVFAAAVFSGLAIDGWMEPLPLIPPPGRVILPDLPRGAAVLELPPNEQLVSVTAMYRGVFHGRPLINGYSGHTPPHYAILSHALKRQDASGIVELARGRPLILIVDSRFDPAGIYRRLVESLPGIERRGASSAGTTYVLPAQPRERIAPGGTPLPATPESLPRAHVKLDLGALRVVRTIEFPLRWHYLDMGERLRVETSSDGHAWETVWDDWTAGTAVAGALEDQLTAPFRIPLPDVRARYLRIHPAPPWMIRELRILGP